MASQDVSSSCRRSTRRFRGDKVAKFEVYKDSATEANALAGGKLIAWLEDADGNLIRLLQTRD